MRRLIMFVVLAAALAGCAEVQPAAAAPPPGCSGYVRTELFFGTTRQGGPEISDAEFRAFLDAEITPRFPDGLTMLTGFGQFRGADGKLARERSQVLVLLYPVNTAPDSGTKIDQIRELYKRKFNQESVLRADDPEPSCVSF
ncbi:hypothetical protein GCM10023321_28520 [Pseudonocardia eucalypti]|uniref:DUF3574 domain-containing protein n=1 Tax=Pseudonocardia eucalypti TaxID=648755 RepID=A0ABP9Q1A9_9PSEU|nr:hypothetical protein [Pseudonocardia eucalypti]